MKIRNGFISNSSSSSFVIYGLQLDKRLENILQKDLPEDEKDDYFYDCEDIDFVIDDDKIYGGYLIASGDDYLSFSQITLDELKNNPKVKKLKEKLNYKKDFYLYTGERQC